ncbi:MAG: hypothetical protein A3G41_07400 [Elusimicrobia bacterium RIFCSPLOWO2_12_FULL_59_9]|nr:MAG: hypothetical protein A3G41_07400 [Elusimicrobia bacterium RIFCSPLOWO2_12_FULL_59_9]
MAKRLAVIIALLFFAGPARALRPDARIFHLDDSVQLAVLNNTELLLEEQNIAIAKQRIKEALFLFFPEIGIEANTTKYSSQYPFSLPPSVGSLNLFPSIHDNVYTGRVSVQHSLHAGQGDTLRLAQAALKQAEADYEAIRLDIAFKTSQVFYRLLLAQEQDTAVAELAAGARKLLEQLKPSGWDEVAAQGSLSRFRALEARSGQDIVQARLDFAKVLNLELDADFRVDGRLETRQVAADLEKSKVWAMEVRPELQAETYKAEMDAISVNLALGRRVPSLIIGAGQEFVGSDFPLRNNNWFVTFGVRFPFSYDYWSHVRKKRAEQRQGQLKRSELQDAVRLQVMQAYENLMFWSKEWPAREKAWDGIHASYDKAVKLSPGRLEMLQGTLVLLEAQMEYLTAIKEHLLAKAGLERAVGRTLE